VVVTRAFSVSGLGVVKGIHEPAAPLTTTVISVWGFRIAIALLFHQKHDDERDRDQAEDDEQRS
jgi:Na+-driven multidrug efflux pump